MAKERPDSKSPHNVGEGAARNLFKDKRLLMNESFSPYLKDHRGKKVIVITARIHPGEAGSSHMCEGMISYLLGPSKDAQML